MSELNIRFDHDCASTANLIGSLLGERRAGNGTFEMRRLITVFGSFLFDF